MLRSQGQRLVALENPVRLNDHDNTSQRNRRARSIRNAKRAMVQILGKDHGAHRRKEIQRRSLRKRKVRDGV